MRQTLYEGKFIRLVDDDGWEFADRVTGDGVVCVVAVDGQHLILIEEFRSAVRAPVISLPAGLIDRAIASARQETPIEAALRELREETGYIARRIEETASGPVSAGMTTEQVTFFLAQDLKPGEQMLDGEEDIRVHRVPMLRLHEWLAECTARGAQIDMKIFAGLYFAKTHGLTPGPLPWLRKLRARVAARQQGAARDGEASPIAMQEASGNEFEADAASSSGSNALARLGKVLNWLGLTIGFICGAWVAICLATLLGMFGPYTDTFSLALLALAGVVVGFVAWLSGRTALYVLAGR